MGEQVSRSPSILKETEPVFSSADDALKGRWHGQRAIIYLKLAATGHRADYADKAIIEFTAAIYHYEQAKHERYCGTNLNNLTFLLYKLGRYRDAHAHLDRAQLIFTKLKDTGNLAQVDETRARVRVAEKRYRDAGARTLAQHSAAGYEGGAGLRRFNAGRARHLDADRGTRRGAARRPSESELVKVYDRATNLLKGTQDAGDRQRLLACAKIVMAERYIN